MAEKGTIGLCESCSKLARRLPQSHKLALRELRRTIELALATHHGNRYFGKVVVAQRVREVSHLYEKGRQDDYVIIHHEDVWIDPLARPRTGLTSYNFEEQKKVMVEETEAYLRGLMEGKYPDEVISVDATYDPHEQLAYPHETIEVPIKSTEAGFVDEKGENHIWGKRERSTNGLVRVRRSTSEDTSRAVFEAYRKLEETTPAVEEPEYMMADNRF